MIKGQFKKGNIDLGSSIENDYVSMNQIQQN